MQALTLHFTGDSNHTIARVGPCVFTLTLINQLKLGGSGRSRTCFSKISVLKKRILQISPLLTKQSPGCGLASIVLSEGVNSPDLRFNHVKLPTHIKTHLNSPSTLDAISPTRGRNSMCFYMRTLPKVSQYSLLYLGRQSSGL